MQLNSRGMTILIAAVLVIAGLWLAPRQHTEAQTVASSGNARYGLLAKGNDLWLIDTWSGMTWYRSSGGWDKAVKGGPADPGGK